MNTELTGSPFSKDTQIKRIADLRKCFYKHEKGVIALDFLKGAMHL